MSEKSLLIVEDDEEIRLPLKIFFEQEGFEVRTAANGQEAVEFLRSNSTPSVIVLDLMMPVMNGWEFLKHKSKDPELSPIPVVVITAANDTRSIDTQAAALVKKPLELDSLLQVVRTYA